MKTKFITLFTILLFSYSFGQTSFQATYPGKTTKTDVMVDFLIYLGYISTNLKDVTYDVIEGGITEDKFTLKWTFPFEGEYNSRSETIIQYEFDDQKFKLKMNEVKFIQDGLTQIVTKNETDELSKLIYDTHIDLYVNVMFQQIMKIPFEKLN